MELTKKPKDPDALNPQQERFCQEYLKDLVGREAAVRAGYATKQAHAQASRMLATPKIQKRVKELIEARNQRTEMDADQVLKELARIGYSDIRQLFDPENGLMLPPGQWPEDLARAIASIEVEEIVDEGRVVGITKKVKFWDKPKALELLGRHQGMFSNKHVHEAGSSLEALVAASRKTKEEEKP